MKHLSKIVLFSLLASFLLPLTSSEAAGPFVIDIYTSKSNKRFVTLEWELAEEIEGSVDVVFQETGDSSTRIYMGQTLNDWQEINHYVNNIGPLDRNTHYTFWLEFAAGTTEDGTNLSTFSDFDQSENKIISQNFYTVTESDYSYIDTYNVSYVMPGDTVRIYGRSLGTGPSDLTDAVAKLGPAEYQQSVLTGDYYEFPITAWSNDYIDLTVPEFNAGRDYQQGKLHLDYLVPYYGNYNDDLFIKVINDSANVDRAIASAYQGDEYRYLLNATRYRYDNRRTTTSYTEEQEQMEWVGDYLTAIGKGIDATWSLVLAYGLVYGDYSRDEIQNEIYFGPGCLQAYIPQSVWSQTDDYAECMANTI